MLLRMTKASSWIRNEDWHWGNSKESNLNWALASVPRYLAIWSSHDISKGRLFYKIDWLNWLMPVLLHGSEYPHSLFSSQIIQLLRIINPYSIRGHILEINSLKSTNKESIMPHGFKINLKLCDRSWDQDKIFWSVSTNDF